MRFRARHPKRRPAGPRLWPPQSATRCSFGSTSRSTRRFASVIAATSSSAWLPVSPPQFSRSAFVVMLFQKTAQLKGWRFEEVVFLWGFTQIPYGLFNVISLNLYDFGNNYIIEGKFDRVLLRPVSSLFQVLFEAFRIESFQEVATGVFCMWWATQPPSPGMDAAEIRDAALFRNLRGDHLRFDFPDSQHRVSFWFEDRIGVHPPVWNVIAFGRYPLSIYSGAVQFFLCWIIPFGLASFYPSVRMLGRTVTPEYLKFVPVVAAAFLTAAISLWDFGTRHYSSTGS